MSPARSDDPLRRVTLNLYEDDCKFLEKHLGTGWTTEVREAVHAYALRIGRPVSTCKQILGPDGKPKIIRLGDLPE